MVGQRLPVWRLRAPVRMLALCVDVVDENLFLFQDVADDIILDIFLLIAQCYFSLNLHHDSDGSSTQAT